MDILLVDLSRRGFRRIGRAKETKFEQIEKDLKRFCLLYDEDLKNGKWIFVASKVGNMYEAIKRASYSDYDIEDPYYIDVAEWDERVLFHRSVNIPEEDDCTCIVCHKSVNTDNPNTLCKECEDKI